MDFSQESLPNVIKENEEAQPQLHESESTTFFPPSHPQGYGFILSSTNGTSMQDSGSGAHINRTINGGVSSLETRLQNSKSTTTTALADLQVDTLAKPNKAIEKPYSYSECLLNSSRLVDKNTNVDFSEKKSESTPISLSVSTPTSGDLPWVRSLLKQVAQKTRHPLCLPSQASSPKLAKFPSSCTRNCIENGYNCKLCSKIENYGIIRMLNIVSSLLYYMICNPCKRKLVTFVESMTESSGCAANSNPPIRRFPRRAQREEVPEAAVPEAAVPEASSQSKQEKTE